MALFLIYVFGIYLILYKSKHMRVIVRAGWNLQLRCLWGSPIGFQMN